MRPAVAITATATDADGNSVTAQRRVTFAAAAVSTNPPSIRRKPSNVFTLSVSHAKDRKSVKLTLAVPGAGAIRAKLTAALKHPARTVTLASGKTTAKRSGKLTLMLRLSKSALKRLRSSHTLKARLAVTFTPTGGTARTSTRRVTLRAPR